MDTIYIGYDPREHIAAQVLIESIETQASRPINIVTLNADSLRRVGLYRRAPGINSTVWANNPLPHMIDMFDKRPFSTEFSFSRFLIPFLNQLEGYALYMDCDMYFREDPCILFDKFADEKIAVSCVKHNYNDGGIVMSQDSFGYGSGQKMYGCPQTKYSRKNWSSFVLWNCGHEANKRLTVDDINTKNGSWLHNFSWLSDDEIGGLPEKWNWLDGHSDESIEPANVHFTTGGPWFDKWKALNDASLKYSEEWMKLSKGL
jgi:hypothetical protein